MPTPLHTIEGFTVRIDEALRAERITDLETLMEMDPTDLYGIPGIGAASLKIINEILLKYSKPVTFYKTNTKNVGIISVSFLRETRNYLIDEHGHAKRKRNIYDNYFKTFQEVKDFLIKRTTKRIETAKSILHEEQLQLKQIQNLQENDLTKEPT